MQKTWKALMVATALTGALVYPITHAQAQQPAPPAATEPTPAPIPAPGRHPEIHRAIAALEKARFHLKNAAHDFGGHREAALAATDEAIKQLKIALQYDKD
jgi:hypothetical protein